MSQTPAVPLTIEGSTMLHQLFRFNWKAWRALSSAEQRRIATSSVAKLKELSGDSATQQTALYSVLGHKGDLIFLHLRDSVQALNQVELQLAQTELYDYLEQTYSYLSVVELGLYESTAKTYSTLTSQHIEPHTPEWKAGIKETLDRQAAAMASRIYPTLPEAQYLCFYPMDRKRGEAVNWYTESMSDRQRMMHLHGMIGRRYAEEVRQIISGSIGLDDWEWGVDLFAADPLTFKRLIYEMRFDEVSAKYALFGSFYVGVKLPVEHLSDWLGGALTK